jgi:D-lactate dehydrogenase
VIGSSCIGASVLGGICNNSGGALVRRGPAYTELALYAQVGQDGVLRLVNHLGIALGDTPEQMLGRLQSLDFAETDIVDDPVRAASDHGYAAHVRQVDADTPARFNADPARLTRPPVRPASCACSRCGWTPSRGGRGGVLHRQQCADDLTAVRRHLLTAFERRRSAANTSTAMRGTSAKSTARTPSC